MLNTIILYKFSLQTCPTTWQITDDVVMGGRSNGCFHISDKGHGVFEGQVSLENNGGFAMVKHSMKPVAASGYSKFLIRLKGDGKRYQLRVKASLSDDHTYVYYFQTTGDWQTVEIEMDEMYPAFRGQKLDMPNYPGQSIAEIGFLIGNDRPESFRLTIDKIAMK